MERSRLDHRRPVCGRGRESAHDLTECSVRTSRAPSYRPLFLARMLDSRRAQPLGSDQARDGSVRDLRGVYAPTGGKGMSITTSRKAGRIATAVTAALALGLTGLLAPAESSPESGGSPHAQGPAQRVVFIVLDQLRPEFIDAFHMTNVQALMAGGGTSFPNAYLGHMGSETVVSHNVMTSGHAAQAHGLGRRVVQRPGRRPRRTAARMYVTGSMSQRPVRRPDQRQGLPEAGRLPAERAPGQHRRHGRREELRGLRMGGPGSDFRVTFSGRNFDCDDADPMTPNTWRGPTGVTCRRTSRSRRGSAACPANTTSTSMPTATSTTAPSTPRRPGCTRCRATATSPATTRTTRAATSG